MPRVASPKSHHVVIDGQKLDRKLLQAFEKSVAGAGDGRVSKKDVETVIAKQMRDSGKLTDVEIATIEYAVKKFKVTTGAKDALGAVAQEMLGRPVFEWQRGNAGGAGGVVGIRALPLTGKAIEKAATDFVLRNVEPILGASADKALPHLDSGNNNLHPSIITGDKAKKAVELFKALEGNSAHELLKKFDPAKHTAIFTVGTEDETHIFLSILDRTTGKAAHVGSQNTVDIGYGVDETQFNAIFGDYRKFTSDPNDPDSEYDYLDGHMLAEWLQEGADFLSVPHAEDAGAGYDKLNKAANDVSEALGSDSWRMPISVDAGILPVVEELPTMARLMFEAGRGEDSGIHYEHDGVPIKVGDKESFAAANAGGAVLDAIAKALVASYPERGAAALPDAKKRAQVALDALGKPGDIAMFQVTSTVKHETNRNKTTEAHTWAFVNEKTGNYLSFYTRPDLG